jgi:hypothetical protein
MKKVIYLILIVNKYNLVMTSVQIKKEIKMIKLLLKDKEIEKYRKFS